MLAPSSTPLTLTLVLPFTTVQRGVQMLVAWKGSRRLAHGIACTVRHGDLPALHGMWKSHRFFTVLGQAPSLAFYWMDGRGEKKSTCVDSLEKHCGHALLPHPLPCFWCDHRCANPLRLRTTVCEIFLVYYSWCHPTASQWIGEKLVISGFHNQLASEKLNRSMAGFLICD